MSPRRTRVARTSRTSRSRPARRARLLTRRAKLNAARRPRRGVLLLVVLSLLVLFLMVGMAFVITAKQSEKAAKSAMKASVRIAGEAAQADLLDEVLRQIIRDTNNPHSSLRFHSLLGDMYGNDGMKGMILPTPSMPSPPPATVLPPKFAGSTTGGVDPGLTGGQMLEFQIGTQATGVTAAGELLRDFYGNTVDAAGNALAFSNIDNAYNGQVLTFLSGIAKGRSTRIVGFIPPNTFRAMNVQLEDGSLISNPTTQLAAARVLINGRPFSGTGVGLNNNARKEYPKLTAREVVLGIQIDEDGSGTMRDPLLPLMPNTAFYNPANNSIASDQSEISATRPKIEYLPPYGSTGFADWNGRGGANESYDAPDFQNMFLAAVSDKDNLKEFEDPTRPTPDLDEVGIPSFHRPDLIYWWRGQFPLTGGDELALKPMLLRKLMLRPNWHDHKNFTGSNPEYATIVAQSNADPSTTPPDEILKRTILGPWDVDNDNNGYRDSVWVDVGLPLMAGPNGKLVKPLAAILCVDMDGRLQANPHGTCDLANAWAASGTGLTAMTSPGVTLNRDGTTSDASPRGVGYGPAEISLGSIMNVDRYRRVLVGDPSGGNLIPGRYGYPPTGGPIRPGMSEQFDVLSQISLNGWPNTPDGVVASRLSTMFSTPPDLRARYGLSLNRYGQPLWEATLQSEVDTRLAVDSPYELNLSANTAAGVQGVATGSSTADAPYSSAELERLLRMYDADAGTLPNRLTDGILRVSSLNPIEREQLRQRLAVDAFDLPAPNVSLPHEMEAMLSTKSEYRRLPRSTADLFEMRVRAALYRTNPTLYPLFPEPITDQNAAIKVRGIMRRIVAPELANGLRLNINRPLGSGRDANDNGVVDEPSESGPIWDVPGAGAVSRFNEPTFPPMASEIVPAADPVANPEGERVDVDHRHLLARHLYALALTLAAPEDYCAQTPPTDNDRELARRIAQWAVNVVDFRDADNIMTSFEYDVNPFDEWEVDGIVGQNSPDDGNTNARGLVWGSERPELVITETLALHDRRTDDLARAYTYPDGKRDTEMAQPGDPDQEKDKDFDQYYRPRGALFVEVHNPWPASTAVNEDTHAASDATGVRSDLGVDLGKTHNNQPDGTPVWRIAVYKRRNSTVQNAANWDPDSQLPPNTNQQPAPFPLRQPSQQIDRSIYFAGTRASFPQDSVAFFNDDIDPVPPVRPGRLLVVGPGNLQDAASGVHAVQIGDRKRDQPGTPRQIALRKNSGDPVTLRGGRTVNLSAAAGNVRMVDADGSTIFDNTDSANYAIESPSEAGRLPHELAFPNDPSKSAVDVAIIRKASAVTTGRPLDQSTVKDRPLSVSEPAGGYPDRFLASRWDVNDEKYEDANEQPMAIDVPLDGPIGGEAALELQFGPLNGRVGENQTTNWPSYLIKYNKVARRWESNVDPVLTQIRDSTPTQDIGASYSFLYLQRLANPLLRWNPEPGHPDHDANLPVNPYFSVDSMSVNLTVYNSRGKDPDGEEEDGSKPNDPGSRFASYERGYTAPNQQAGLTPSNMAYQIPSGLRAGPPNADLPLQSTPDNRLRTATLKETFAFKFNRVPFHTLGILNRAFQNLNAAETPPLTDAEKKSEPIKPFEWLPWNNRPFVSGRELMLVPRTRSSEIVRRYATADQQQAPPNAWPFDAPVKDDLQKPKQLTPFNQLENFFAGEPSAGAPPDGVPIHLYRVLEYVHVPSLFAGTETWLNPSTTQQLFGVNSTQFTGALDPRIQYQAPFNSISEFRDPGRVNVNTVNSEQVYKGLFHDYTDGKPHVNPGWDKFVQSRRSDGNSEPFYFNASSPSFMSNPFRSPDAGDLVPLNSMRRAGVDCTLQRSVDPPTATAGSHALPGSEPLLVNSTTVADHNDWKRNPYFHFQPIVRLDNLVTTRSNMFAVWVTIGFFEVEEAPEYSDFRNDNGNLPDNAETQALYKQVYPEGYAFAREDGVDVGNTRRLRGFYMIDRTMMAGFEPGADHNVENVIRLRRRIE